MQDTLDLVILDASPLQNALVYGRYNSDIAVSRLPLKSVLPKLLQFRDRIRNTLQGREKTRPTLTELLDFGTRLFSFCMRDDVNALYQSAKAGKVRIHILSNHPAIQAVPWEYLQEPQQAPGPRSDRSVVRIVPLVGKTCPAPISHGQRVRVLFVSAEPNDQDPLSWDEEKLNIRNAFETRLDRLKIVDFEAVDGASTADVHNAVNSRKFDVFHFSGHGVVSKGQGHLVLRDKTSGNSTLMSADKLAALLVGRQLRLVVLSACDTSAGDFSKPFAVIAETLVREGIPAVIANQFPMPNKTVAAFMSTMYQSLLINGDIDYAVSEGRITLLNELIVDDQEAPLEWGIPTVYRHVAGNVFMQ